MESSLCVNLSFIVEKNEFRLFLERKMIVIYKRHIKIYLDTNLGDTVNLKSSSGRET